jgi:hypothetical protein
MTQPVRHWLRLENLDVKEEFELPWGICDLVALSFDNSQVKKRLSYRQYRPIGPVHRIELLRHIPDQDSGSAVTLRQLRNLSKPKSFAPPLQHELQSLITNRLIIRNKNGSLQKLNGWAPMHDRIVAVELKLCRISEALAQAVSNCAFATESYVALPATVAERLTKSNRQVEFGRAGVGILGVSTTTCKVVLPASCQIDPDVTLQMHCVERFWRTRDRSA